MLTYQGYNKRVRLSTCSLSCMQCPVDHLRRPYDHARHLYDVHDLDKNTTCPWCLLDFSKKLGLMQNIDHLAECLQRLEAQTKEYRELLRSETTTLDCCGEDFLTPCDYERHVRERHGLCCPWCREEGRHSAEHLTKCLKDRLLPVVVTFAEEPRNREPCEPCLNFDSREEKRKFLGRKPIGNISPFFYESFGESLKAEGEFLRFDEASGLGSDAGWYVRRFVDQDWKWFHYFVKGFAFESFHRAFEGNESVSLLPFWCLCDGGKSKKSPAYRHHRHGIAVCRDGGKSFLAAWKKVGGVQKFKHQNAKYYRIITTPHHLCNVMTYVGGTRSRCDGLLLKKTGSIKECHYHINRPICPHGNFYLHMCYENGLEDRLNTLHANRDVHDLPSLRSEGRILRVRLGDFPKGSMTGCSPPWAGMENEDKRAYFERQAAKGEGYVECMDDREYVLKSKVQKRMAKSVLAVRKQALVENKEALETMSEAVRYRNDAIRRLETNENDLTAEIQKLKSEIARQAETVRDLKAENESLRQKSDESERIRVLEKEHRAEIRDLKEAWRVDIEKAHALELVLRAEIRDLKEEVRDLKQKLSFSEKTHALNIEHLAENEKLKAENKILREKAIDTEKYHVREIELKDACREEVEKVRLYYEKVIADLKEGFQKERVERENDIKRLLREKFDEAVRERLEKENLHVEIRKTLRERHAEVVKAMEEKMDFKDRLCAFVQKTVQQMWWCREPVSSPPLSRKRRKSTQ